VGDYSSSCLRAVQPWKYEERLQVVKIIPSQEAWNGKGYHKHGCTLRRPVAYIVGLVDGNRQQATNPGILNKLSPVDGVPVVGVR
jgi:hypothetical protein